MVVVVKVFGELEIGNRWVGGEGCAVNFVVELLSWRKEEFFLEFSFFSLERKTVRAVAAAAAAAAAAVNGEEGSRCESYRIL